MAGRLKLLMATSAPLRNHMKDRCATTVKTSELLPVEISLLPVFTLLQVEPLQSSDFM